MSSLSLGLSFPLAPLHYIYVSHANKHHIHISYLSIWLIWWCGTVDLKFCFTQPSSINLLIQFWSFFCVWWMISSFLFGNFLEWWMMNDVLFRNQPFASSMPSVSRGCRLTTVEPCSISETTVVVNLFTNMGCYICFSVSFTNVCSRIEGEFKGKLYLPCHNILFWIIFLLPMGNRKKTTFDDWTPRDLIPKHPKSFVLMYKNPILSKKKKQIPFQKRKCRKWNKF